MDKSSKHDAGADGVVDAAAQAAALRAAALASGDVSAFAQRVDFARLGDNDKAITAPGYYNRIFRSRQPDQSFRRRLQTR